MAKKTVKRNSDGTITVWGSKGYEGKISTAGKTQIPTTNIVPAVPVEETPANPWERFQGSLDRMEQYLKTGGVARWVTGDGDREIKNIRMKLMRRMIFPAIISGQIATSLSTFGEHPFATVLSTTAISGFVGLAVTSAKQNEGTVKRTREISTIVSQALGKTEKSYGSVTKRRRDPTILVPSDIQGLVAKELSSVGRAFYRSRWKDSPEDVTEKYFQVPLQKYAQKVESEERDIGEKVSIAGYKVHGDTVTFKIKYYNWIESSSPNNRIVEVKYNVTTGTFD